MNTASIHIGTPAKLLLIINVVMALIYFSWWLDPSHVGNRVLFNLLLAGEIYHLIMAFTFWFTIWPRKTQHQETSMDSKPSVDVFITVAGEPEEVIRQTAAAAKAMHTFPHEVYFLNDGFALHKENWEEAVQVSNELGIHCITRDNTKGAKAGNINNALRHTGGEIVVIFDADMVPHPDFLAKTIPFFADQKMGFVQTPQYYKNFPMNRITKGAWNQQEFFFGPVMNGKDKTNSAFICGTNVAIRKTTLLEAGGMAEDNIAEDFLTSLFIHQKGWKSHYLTEVLAEGLAPQDLLAYYKQQLRWARGSLEIAFRHNPLFKRHLKWRQRIEYLSSALYYLNGLVVFVDMMMPLIFLLTGIQAVSGATTSLAFFFIPFMFMNLYTLYVASDGRVSFGAISFSQASWTLQLVALLSLLTGRKMGFSITPKQKQAGNYFSLTMPHILYTVVAFVSIAYAIGRTGLNPSVATNAAWAFFNILIFLPFMLSSVNWREKL